MAELFAGGRIVDLIVGLLVLEGFFLAVLYKNTGRGLAPVALLTNLLAGFFLLLALRAALVQASWGWVALCLAAALLAHLADLRQRWRTQ